MKTNKVFKSHMQWLRQQANLSQKEVANIAGITDTCYQIYEYGAREPKAGTAILIASALGTTVEDLWGSKQSV